MKTHFVYIFSLLFYCSSLNADSETHLDYSMQANNKHQKELFYPGSLAILPQDGRQIYFEAFEKAKDEIRIEICVLEDPLILESLQNALKRGIKVRVIVDKRKYESTPNEQVNLATYLIENGGELHLSNEIFPRSFPKVILIDNCFVLISSACLDTLTFEQYRDYTYVTNSKDTIHDLSNLFENDWIYSAKPGQEATTFNPTPVIGKKNLIIAPVNASNELVSFIQSAKKTLDVTSELLGNPTLESELFKASSKGVHVRLIAPEIVNNATFEMQQLQISSLIKLKAAGLHIHVTRLPESAQFPYMHARTAIADGKIVYIGSISLSPNSSTYNRGVGIILKNRHVVDKMKKQFEIDYHLKSFKF